METFVTLLPGFNLGVFMCRIVVADDTILFARLDAAVDRIQKFDPLLMAMLGHACADDLTTCDVECGKQ